MREPNGSELVSGRAARIERAAGLAVLGLGLWIASCAQEGVPPGGPPDTTPPELWSFSPESLAVDVDATAPLAFTFSEKMDRRAFRSALILAPDLGLRGISFKGSQVIIRPERPWPADSVVAWVLRPSAKDKRGVPMGAYRWGVFSTGDTIPDGAIEGQALIEERKPEEVVLASLSLPPEGEERLGTLWRLLPAADDGRFRLWPLDLPSGPFDLEVFVDKNGNQRRDEREAVARADSLYLAPDIRILDLGPLQLVDLEAPVDLWVCLADSMVSGLAPADSLGRWVSFRPVGGLEAQPTKAMVDSTGCTPPRPLVPGSYEIGAWIDLDGDGYFGPDSTGISEPFSAPVEWDVLPAVPDTLLISRPAEVLPWAVVDTMRTPPIPRELYRASSP